MKSFLSLRSATDLWLNISMVFVLAMVFIGGLTRLTGSGLSITEWQVVSGILPPFLLSEWQEMFAKYQQIPEFIIENPDMTLAEFKKIFWFEYFHRLLARVTGLIILIPAILLLLRARDSIIKGPLYLLLILLPVQGFIGWFMVKSGLSLRTDVSHFRLATHLTMALIIFLTLLETKLRLKDFSKLQRLKFNIWSVIFALFCLQLVWGAFVAGLKAGYIYNDYPLMGGDFVPKELFYLKSFFANLFYNNVLVQFMHRHFAIIISLVVFISFIKKRVILREKGENKDVIFLLIILAIQFILGVLTLLTSVNILIALLHQLSAFILLGRSYICMRRVSA